VELAQRGAAWCAQAGIAAVFLPVQTISEPANGTKHVEPSSASVPDPAASGGKIEITLPDGTSIKVGDDVGLVALRRVITVLRR
jgi:transposase